MGRRGRLGWLRGQRTGSRELLHHLLTLRGAGGAVRVALSGCLSHAGVAVAGRFGPGGLASGAPRPRPELSRPPREPEGRLRVSGAGGRRRHGRRREKNLLSLVLPRREPEAPAGHEILQAGRKRAGEETQRPGTAACDHLAGGAG